MPAPLMFTGIGELIVILLIVAFVVACFCLMLVGLGALIAIPLLLIMPLFGKKVKWDKESFLGWLLFIPIGLVLGIMGVELAKVFMSATIDIANRFSFMSWLLIVFFGGIILSNITSGIINYKLSKESRQLEKKIRQSDKGYDFAQRDKLKEKKESLEKIRGKRDKLVTLLSFILVSIVWGIFYIITNV